MGFEFPWSCSCFGGGAASTQTKKKPRIDKSMIGEPTNFEHTGHIGSSDMGQMSSVSAQMQSKGGHTGETAAPPAASPVSNALPIKEALAKRSSSTAVVEPSAGNSTSAAPAPADVTPADVPGN